MKPRILVVDDEKNIRRTLRMILTSAGYEVREAESGELAERMLEETPSEIVLLDIGLPGRDGIETLRVLRPKLPCASFLMISGRATVSHAVEAVHLGAFDFLEKPLSKDRVLIAVQNGLRLSRLGSEVESLKQTAAGRHSLVGESAAVRELRRQIERIAPTGATVLVTGESGVGKEVVARTLHQSSKGADGPFIRVNCAAIPEELIETELFGCVKGAYTGADRARDGKFLLADGGTIFLDEIGDMSLRVQAKVLRALQEKEIERVGDSEPIRVEVRVLAATNKDLPAEVAAGRFREDLYYRLAVVPLAVPPLRERADDVERLARHFLRASSAELGNPELELADCAVDELQRRSWPGNVRELRNVVERAAILSDGPRITGQALRSLAPESAGVPQARARAMSSGIAATAGIEAARSATAPATFPVPGLDSIREAGGLVRARRRFEREVVRAALARTGGNVSQAAQILNIERSNLHKKIQGLGLDDREMPEETES